MRDFSYIKNQVESEKAIKQKQDESYRTHILSVYDNVKPKLIEKLSNSKILNHAVIDQVPNGYGNCVFDLLGIYEGDS